MNIMLFRYLLLAFTLLSLPACSQPPYTNIDNQQLISLKSQGIPVYDIRRADEWKQTGTVEGSHRLTFVDDNGRVMPDFMSKFTQAVGKNDPVILLCRSGNRSDSLARALMEQAGYTKIYNVKNGMNRWLSEGLPVIRN